MSPTPLPSYRAERLAELDNAELIELLIRDEDRAPRNLVDALAGRGDSAVADLEARFASADAWSADVSNGAWWLRLHAAMVFGLVPTANAAHALMRWMRRIDAAADGDMQDWLSGFWPALFRNKPPDVIEPLRELAADPRLGWFARGDALEALVSIAERLGPAALETELEWVALLAADEQEDWDARLTAGHVLLDFPRPAHRELLDSLAARQNTLGMFTRSDVEEAYASDRDEPQWRLFADPWKFYTLDAIEARQRRWAEERASELDLLSEDELPEWVLEEPCVRTAPKIGRNVPCPCGSGKKYKKCCL